MRSYPNYPDYTRRTSTRLLRVTRFALQPNARANSLSTDGEAQATLRTSRYGWHCFPEPALHCMRYLHPLRACTQRCQVGTGAGTPARCSLYLMLHCTITLLIPHALLSEPSRRPNRGASHASRPQLSCIASCALCWASSRVVMKWNASSIESVKSKSSTSFCEMVPKSARACQLTVVCQ